MILSSILQPEKKIEKLDTWDTWMWGKNHLPGPSAALLRPPLAWRTPMSREIERDDIGGCQLLPEAHDVTTKNNTKNGTSTDLWCTGSRLFTYGYPYTYYIIYIYNMYNIYILYYILYTILYIYNYTTMTFNSNKSRKSDGDLSDLSSWRIEVFAAPVQQLQAIALNESCHLVARLVLVAWHSLAPCSSLALVLVKIPSGLLQWLTMSC